MRASICRYINCYSY